MIIPKQAEITEGFRRKGQKMTKKIAKKETKDFSYEDDLPDLPPLSPAELEKENAVMKKKNLADRLLRMYLTPRQKRLLVRLKQEWGMTVSEHVRRAIDLYLDGLIAKGDLKDD